MTPCSRVRATRKSPDGFSQATVLGLTISGNVQGRHPFLQVLHRNVGRLGPVQPLLYWISMGSPVADGVLILGRPVVTDGADFPRVRWSGGHQLREARVGGGHRVVQ